MKILSQRGVAHIFLLLAVLGLLLFLLISNTFSFRDRLFSNLFPKPPSQAAAPSDWPQLQYNSLRSGFTNTSVTTPYTIKWRWHPISKFVSISGKVQPVIANGVMCLGFYDGKMYCLDENTGIPRWEFQTGGPILHTAAIDGANIYFGSQDGNLYAVQTSNGQLAWKYKTGKGIQNAPCIVSNTVYIGSSDGYMYAFDAVSGSLKWRYDSGYPILTSAACGNNTIYFGNEGIYAHALQDNGASASLKWKKRLAGQSMSAYWPVLSQSQNIVFFRTQPYGVLQTLLDDGDNILAQGPAIKNATNIAAEQQRIITHLNGGGAIWKTFWALDANTGNERYTAPILYTAGEGSTPVPLVIDDAGSKAWVVWKTRYKTFGCPNCTRPWVDLGKMDLATGTISHFAGPESAYVHLIGDETTILTANSNGLLASGRGTLSGIDLTSETSFSIVNSLRSAEDDYSNGDVGPFAYDNGWVKGDVLGGGGQGGPVAAGATVANGKMFWVARYGLIIAIE